MDLLFQLQQLREYSGTVLPSVLSVISEMVIYVGPLVPIILYLCINKKLGAKMMFVFGSADFFCNVIKLGACVKRPWLRDSRLHPAGDVEGGATGYSFPSGHTSAAVSIYGGIAQWLKKRLATIICVFMIILTGFTRLFLGVHTLSDVLFALLMTIVIAFIAQFIFKAIENKPERDIWVLIVGLILCVSAGLYIGLKSYPLDLMEDGTYLYVKMQKDGFATIGMMAAWIICWFVERRFIKFDIEGSVKEKIIRGFIAVVLFVLFYFVITKLAFAKADPRVYYFFKRFLSVIVVVGVYPLCLVKFKKKKD